MLVNFSQTKPIVIYTCLGPESGVFGGLGLEYLVTFHVGPLVHYILSNPGLECGPVGR